ncbi:hypothetical protein HYS99_01410 [Candidatus Giovannonibacteria bacterium]|nr:hypothetical protein [Candidatus Giovannonibacteria bacterium]
MQDYYLDRVKSLSRQLSKPDFFCETGGVSFYLYKAKNLHNPKWINENLYKITLILRRSYFRYGKRTLIDEYDKKSAIYLVRAQKGSYEEWLSYRFTPNNGKPIGGGEIEIFSSNGISLSDIARKKLFKGQKNFWRYIVSTSRMCGVPLRTPHKYTGLCFAIISYVFILDSIKNKYPFKYTTGIINEKLVKDALTVRKGQVKLCPHFTPSYKTLHISKNSVKINRNIYTYKFPTYFLNNTQLLSTLKKLVNSKDLPKSVLNLEKFSEFISKNGKIRGSRLTREELRSIIDKNVKDGPEFKLTKILDWNRSILRFIDKIGIKSARINI